MIGDTTLRKLKARCAHLTEEYGERSCDNCEYADLGCCDSPDRWNFGIEEDKPPTSHPDWEAMFRRSEKDCHELRTLLDESRANVCCLEEENRKLRTIVSAVETLLGRKFD